MNNIRHALKEAHPTSFFFKMWGGPYSPIGIPDLIGCVYGRFIGIEVKAQRATETEAAALKRVTPAQRAVLGLIERAGGIAGVALTVAQALELVAEAAPVTEEN